MLAKALFGAIVASRKLRFYLTLLHCIHIIEATLDYQDIVRTPLMPLLVKPKKRRYHLRVLTGFMSNISFSCLRTN